MISTTLIDVNTNSKGSPKQPQSNPNFAQLRHATHGGRGLCVGGLGAEKATGEENVLNCRVKKGFDSNVKRLTLCRGTRENKLN